MPLYIIRVRTHYSIALIAVKFLVTQLFAPVKSYRRQLPIILFVMLFISNRGVGENLLQSGAWRYGNANLYIGPRGLRMNDHDSEATLVGTVINPVNLTNFTLKMRWSFGEGSNHVVRVGWGKPFEWSAFDLSVGQISVRSDGEVKVFSGKQVIGSLRYPIGKKGEVALAVSRQSNAIILRYEGKDSVFKLPVDLPLTGGYLTLSAKGYKPQKETLFVSSLEIEGAGNAPAFTEAQREDELWRWEKIQLDSNWATLTNIETAFKEKLEGRWRYKTDLRVEPGLVKPGEKVRLHFHCADQVPPECAATLTPNYLSDSSGAPRALMLHWRDAGEGTHEAVVDVTPELAGNWRVVWQVGGETLTRVFGVVDEGCTVVRILTTSDQNLVKTNPAPAGFDAIHDAGLPSDFWGDYWKFSQSLDKLVPKFDRLVQFHHRWGDQPAF